MKYIVFPGSLVRAGPWRTFIWCLDGDIAFIPKNARSVKRIFLQILDKKNKFKWILIKPNSQKCSLLRIIPCLWRFLWASGSPSGVLDQHQHHWELIWRPILAPPTSQIWNSGVGPEVGVLTSSLVMFAQVKHLWTAAFGGKKGLIHRSWSCDNFCINLYFSHISFTRILFIHNIE